MDPFSTERRKSSLSTTDFPSRRPSTVEHALSQESINWPTRPVAAAGRVTFSHTFSDDHIPELPSPETQQGEFGNYSIDAALHRQPAYSRKISDEQEMEPIVRNFSRPITKPEPIAPVRRDSSSRRNSASGRRNSSTSRRESLSWFGRRSSSAQSASNNSQRRWSSVAPGDAAAGEAMDPDAPALAPPLARRASLFDASRRRSSQFWQTAVGDAETPGYIRRGSMAVRSASITSIKGLNTWMGAPARRISVFEEDLDLHKQDIIEFIATVKSDNEKRAKTRPWFTRSRFFPPLYVLSVCLFIYFVFIGLPLWDGLALTYYHYFSHQAHLAIGTAVFVSWAGLQAFLPLVFCRFEQEVDPIEGRDSSEVALIIPAYKAAGLLGPTIEHALKIFKKSQIFIIANGNSAEPLDNAAEVCAAYGVNHYWVPIGSKITAEFVGVAVAAKFKYVMLIDDDVHLPENLPIVTNRIGKQTKCIGYTIKSTGANGALGSYVQQCQDMEYKSSGLTRTWGGRWGSATFPHGAIILWEREALQSLFTSHPGFVISEDWYFGHVARQAGYRIEFCSQVFVETETPPCLLWDNVGGRGGYGEMTVWKQRFYRWNYFYLFRIYDDMKYLLFNWRLGWREITAKYAIMIEVVDSVINLFRPFIFVISFILNARLTAIYIGVILALYIVAFVVINAYQLRLKNEMVSWKIMPMYFFMKFVLLWFGTASMYYGLYSYIKYFAQRHPKVIENHKALEAAYNIRCGVELVPLAATVSEVVEAVEEVQQARREGSEAHEITVASTSPIAGLDDLEKGLVTEKDAQGHEVVSRGLFAGFSMG